MNYHYIILNRKNDDDDYIKQKIQKFRIMHYHYYNTALREIINGKKESHWIWYIFPQIKGLGKSQICLEYDIISLKEAKAFLEDDILGNNLSEITKYLLNNKYDKNKEIRQIMNELDAMKLKSCMTLFNTLFKLGYYNKNYQGIKDKNITIFKEVINVFYNGKEDELTKEILKKQDSINRSLDDNFGQSKTSSNSNNFSNYIPKNSFNLNQRNPENNNREIKSKTSKFRSVDQRRKLGNMKSKHNNLNYNIQEEDSLHYNNINYFNHNQNNQVFGKDDYTDKNNNCFGISDNSQLNNYHFYAYNNCKKGF